MTNEEHKRKLIRLRWIRGMADRFNTKIYDDEIYELSNEIEGFEEKEYKIPLPTPQGLLIFHLERLGLKKCEMADRMGLSANYFCKIYNGDAKLSPKMEDKLINFNYKSL
jgi:antitoxin component HigA of HigAB toxin-antitoxin module